jgi:hypothetical protein
MLEGDGDDDWRLLKMGEGGMIGDDDECWIVFRRKFEPKRNTQQPPPPQIARVNGDKDGLWSEIEDG